MKKRILSFINPLKNLTMNKIFTILVVFVCLGLVSNAQNSRLAKEFLPQDPTLLQKSILSQSYLQDSLYTYGRNQAGTDWENTYRDYYSYDDAGNMTERINWMLFGGTMQKSQKYSYSYTNNNLTEEIRYNWWTNSWTNYKKINSTYNSANYITESIESEWQNNAWKSILKNNFTYDANNNLVEEIEIYWNDSLSNWLNMGKIENTFDANNNLTLSIVYGYNSTTNEWVNYWKYEYTYDANNNLTLSIWYSAQYGTSTWNNYRKEEFIYNTNNKITEKNTYNWSSNTWTNSYKYIFEYDANENLIHRNETIWSSGTWVNLWNYSWTYDSNNNLIEYYSSNWVAKGWTDFEKITYYTSLHEVTNVSGIVSNLTVYPNPATNTLTINNIKENATISIFNLSGAIVFTKKITATTATIDLSSFRSGIYILKIEENSGTTIQKIVKQ